MNTSTLVKPKKKRMAMIIIMERTNEKALNGEDNYYPVFRKSDQDRFNKFIGLLKENTAKPQKLIEEMIVGTLSVACRHLKGIDVVEMEKVGCFRKVASIGNRMYIEYSPDPLILYSLVSAGFRMININDN